jgi:hypothetical protein
MKLASFALSRRDPEYVGRAKKIQDAGGASCIFAECPGDGSAREQAASCQRVLGGAANICRKFATKRYRSNCINWGMLPLTLAPARPLISPPATGWRYPAQTRRGERRGRAAGLYKRRGIRLYHRAADKGGAGDTAGWLPYELVRRKKEMTVERIKMQSPSWRWTGTR